MQAKGIKDPKVSGRGNTAQTKNKRKRSRGTPFSGREISWANWVTHPHPHRNEFMSAGTPCCAPPPPPDYQDSDGYHFDKEIGISVLVVEGGKEDKKNDQVYI